MHQIIKCYWLLLLLLLLISFSAEASHHCSQWLAKVISFQGKVDIQFQENSAWQSITLDQTFCHGDKIRTAKNSRATLLFTNESRATLAQNSTLILLAPEKKVSSWYLELLQGSGFFRSRQSQRLNVHTPYINAVHEGTEFLVTVNSEQTEITVFDGQVAATNQTGEIHIKKGYTGIANKSQPPHLQALTIRPEDTVQWTLYYPPIIDYKNSELSKSDKFQHAIKAYQQGDIYQALTLLNKIPASQQNANYLTLKSSLLLTVGSVDEALTLNDKALLLETNNSSAFALLSIIAVTKNRQEKAFDLAQKAVKSNPQSAVAQIALSYAYQSLFKIESALKATEEATRLSPDNALAWARLSELQLSTGERSAALKSAQKAQQLNPKLDRTQTILGFAYLAQIDIDQAKTAFDAAINLNSADPLARLGLGLAKIRKGDVEEGTGDLETAVSLDPDNAIMRSYLGKAYYELKNDEFAGTELAIAKEMDPNDPTAWFYDAIRQQTINRPIDALHHMQKAIELNNNRGVYRSKLLLDEDMAARSASLGRIYNDLGFQQLGLVEGWKSINTDPGNYSAHRLLADNYSGLPLHEIARASELLQSQLLQPINIIPVQPQLAESNLLILDGLGSANPSFNEYNPLFARNRLAFQASGIFGSHNTFGNEAIQSGLWNNLSYSLGQFHFETDGYRDNNDLNRDTYNAFVQGYISPELSILANYRYDEFEHGDIQLNFDANDNDPFFRKKLRTNTAQIGIKYKPANHSTFIASGLFQKENESQKFETGDLFLENEGFLSEGQYLFQSSKVSFTLGGGYFNQKVQIIALAPVQNLERQFNFNVEHANGYLYTYTRYPKQLTWTLGVSFDQLNDGFIGKIKTVNPKLGVSWNITSNSSLRLAAFRVLRRSLVTDQTIEPTQVAGFNQFFHDGNGAESRRYGVGFDHKFTQNLFTGVEFSLRDIKTPIANFNKTDDWQEKLFKAYFNWTITSNISFNVDYSFERFKRKRFGPDSDIYPSTSTHIVPATFNFFHASGFIGFLRGSYVQQEVDFFSKNSGSDAFYLVDVGMGYRLPKQYGVINVAVKNIFDQNFRYEDVGSRSSKDQLPMFLPERSIRAQITLAF